VRPFIGEIRQGMAGGSTPQDLETLFQLLYLRFTQPRADPTAFAAMRSQALGMLANQGASPEAVFEQTLEATLSGDSPRRRPESAESVGRWNLEKSLAFYRARFTDASSFTFVFVGSFTTEQIKPLVESYVASLPATRANETWRDLGITPPRGIVAKTVEKGIAPKSEVSITFSGPFQYDDANLLALRTIVMLLQSRLNDAIRQELGGTYNITANSQTSKYPRPDYRVRIDWTCDPERVDSLVQRVFQEIEFVRSSRLGPEQVARVREFLNRDLEDNSEENGYLLSQISRKYEDGDAANVAAALRQGPQIAALNSDALQVAARAYLDTANYVKVVLMPQRTK
jgi:zinc protease